MKKKNNRGRRRRTNAEIWRMVELELHVDFFFHVRLSPLATQVLETRVASLNLCFIPSRC